MKQAVEVFQEFIKTAGNHNIPRQVQRGQFGEVFIGTDSLLGLNQIEELKGKKIMRLTGGFDQTFVFEQSTQTQNTITALHNGQNDRIQAEGRTTGTIQQAINCLEGSKIVDISTGKTHVMILTQEGQLYSYGYGQYGLLGHGGSSFEDTPRIIKKLQRRVVQQVACGMFHTLALSNYGDVYSWGRGFEGQLGIRKDLECCSSPQVIGGFYKYAQGEIGYLKKTAVKEIACGAYHSMAIDVESCLYCWGEARLGQIGNGRKVKQPVPVRIEVEGNKIVKVAAGYGHTVCLTEEGEIYSWGLNTKGQLGIGDASETTKTIRMDNELENIKVTHYPMRIKTDGSKRSLPKFRHIACGFNSSFAIDADGGAWGWGGDTNGFRDEEHCERAPKRIAQGTEDRQFSKVFSNQDTVVFFAPVRVLSFNPTIGPSNGQTQITFFGTGFSNTDLQKVKFRIGEQQLVSDCQFDPSSCTYFCKSPNFQEVIQDFPCESQISVSLDGVEFYPYLESFLIYPSTLTAQSIEPKNASVKGGQELKLAIHLPDLVSSHIPSVIVGFRLSSKESQETEKPSTQKPSWNCVQGTYSEGQIQCKIPKILKYNPTNSYYHVDISINGQQFSGLPNTIRFYDLTNLDLNPKQGYEEGNYPMAVTGDGLFDSSRKKIRLKVVFGDKTNQWPQLIRQVETLSWDKIQKAFTFDMLPLSWLLCGNQPTPQLVAGIKAGNIQVKLTLSGVQWVSVGNFRYVDPPPPAPEPEEEKDPKKGAKKAAKK